MLIILCLNLLILAHFRKISVAGRVFFILFFLFLIALRKRKKEACYAIVLLYMH